MAIEVQAVARTYDRISFGHKNEVLMGYEYEIANNDYNTDTWEGGHPNKAAPLPSRFHGRYESLGNTMGFEIKSPVAPLQYHKLRAPVLFNKLNFTPRKNNEGGIHVHVTRPDRLSKHPWGYPTLPSCDEAVFDFMFNRKVKDTFLHPISGRSRYSWNNYCEGRRTEHYGVINQRTDNYEVRVFKAKVHLLIPALEFCDGLFSYAYSKGTSFDITVDGLIAYFNKHKKYNSISKVIKENYRG